MIFDNESVNRGLPVLVAARGLDSWRRPEGSRPLGTRLIFVLNSLLTSHFGNGVHEVF